jgi:two-component system sensor histidine kinase HydH
VSATIAHEIKNPLSSVKTLAQLMREDGEVREKYDRDLGYMIGETDRLNRSLQQLLSFSRPSPEQVEEVDLSGLLELMAEMLARQYQAEQVRFERAIAPGLALKHSNAEIVKQIFLNLLLNAAQCSEPGGSVRIEAVLDAQGKMRVAISDEGPGIPQSIRDKIFEPFFTTKQRGTGLGLAIVRKNIRHFGGEIEVESPIRDGRGTRVTVILPAE